MHEIQKLRAFVDDPARDSVDADRALNELIRLLDDAHRLLTTGCSTKEEFKAVVKRIDSALGIQVPA